MKEQAEEPFRTKLLKIPGVSGVGLGKTWETPL